MSINNTISMIAQGANDVGRSLIFQTDSEFASTLALGQIIKGKVLRHYEGSRYAVSFSGQEKIVDSSVPLKTGELISGRVVGLGDQVRLRKIPTQQQEKVLQQSDHETGSNPSHKGSLEQAFIRLFDRHQIKAIPSELTVLKNSAAGVSRPEVFGLIGVLIRKFGLTVQPLLVRALYRAINESSQAKDASQDGVAELLAVVSDRDGLKETTVKQLADTLRAYFSENYRDFQFNPKVEPDSVRSGLRLPDTPVRGESFGDNSDGRGRNDEWQLGRYLLNTQNGGTVAHRLATFPIWLGGKLVEVNVAFFSQTGRELSGEKGIRYQKLVFELNTESFGSVEVVVRAADRHLRIMLVAEDSDSLDNISSYMGGLRRSMSDLGWETDEISYCMGADNEQGRVVQAVVEHHMASDSLSVLI